MRYGILLILALLSACAVKQAQYECKNGQTYVYAENMNAWMATGNSCLKAEEIESGN